MDTKGFNALDLLIYRWRSRMVRRFIRPGAVVLDFGCGHDSLFLRSVQGIIKRGIGVDYDAVPGQPAENVEIQRFRFAGRFDFPDRTCDQITILAVLEHIPIEMVGPLLDEFHRILKEDGWVLITTPTPASKPLLEVLAFKLKVISAPEIADHKHYYSQADIRALATTHGFQCAVYRTFQCGLNSFSVLSKTTRSVRREGI